MSVNFQDRRLLVTQLRDVLERCVKMALETNEIPRRDIEISIQLNQDAKRIDIHVSDSGAIAIEDEERQYMLAVTADNIVEDIPGTRVTDRYLSQCLALARSGLEQVELMFERGQKVSFSYTD